MRRRNYLRAIGGVGTGTALGLAGTGVGAAAEPCYYQVDFVAGDVEDELGESEDDFYGAQDRLIQYLHGEGDEVTKRDTWINSLDPDVRECVASDPIAVDDGTATVSFTVAEGCELRLSLAAYTMPDSTFGFDTADEQELVDGTTGTFGPGTHELEVTLPCGGESPSPPEEPPNVVITRIHANAGGDEYENLDDEYVVIENRDDETVDLTGWTLEDPEDGQVYDFPDDTALDPEETLAVVTGSEGGEGGPAVGTTLYWGRDTPAWNNTGDTAVLRDADGTEISRFEYGSTSEASLRPI